MSSATSIAVGFGGRVAAARRDKGWTQAQLAAKVGRAMNTIARLERGEHCPLLDLAARLADVLEVPLGRLTGEGK